MDETALYYRFSLNNNLSSKQLQGGAKGKSRIITNFCYNADGSYKLDIFFIAKVLRPYAFRNIRRIEILGY
jgi:hypothetical protein